MLSWWLALIALVMGIRLLFAEDGATAMRGLLRREERELAGVIAVFQELEETLEAGMVPEDDRWRRIDALPDPWGRVAGTSLRELRESGSAVLPTLKRLRQAAAHHRDALQEARARSAQAMAQAGICAAMAPLAGFAYYHLIPGLDQRPTIWMGICFGALLLSASAGFWMIRIAEVARWAGLAPAQRRWVLASQIAAERLLASIRGGTPADLAWGRALETIRGDARDLAACWGESIWQPALGELDGTKERLSGTARALAEFGDGMRRSIQTALMEGRPVTERLETALAASRSEMRSAIERELTLLSTRTLKPLFLLVAPAMVGLLVAGFFLSSLSDGGFLL